MFVVLALLRFGSLLNIPFRFYGVIGGRDLVSLYVEFGLNVSQNRNRVTRENAVDDI